MNSQKKKCVVKSISLEMTKSLCPKVLCNLPAGSKHLDFPSQLMALEARGTYSPHSCSRDSETRALLLG